jgi:DNA excision repair protein ERCC-2
MRFDLDGLDVFFPYDRIYLEQHQYMRSLKQALDAGGHCLLEMPTGTGKTVCLLSLITSYQFANPSAGKLVYCTRTVPEMNSVMEELGIVLAHRAEQLALQDQHVDMEDAQQQSNAGEETSESHDSTRHAKKPRRVYSGKKKSARPPMGPIMDGRGAGGSGVLAVCLSSRRNMCVHERVLHESDREAVDAACRSMTASWVIEAAAKNPGSMETCSYYDNFQAAGEATTMPSGIYDLEELKKWGKSRGWCPYYLTRQAINHANILVFNYQYMLDPKVAKMVSKELEAESIIVFDEVRNLPLSLSGDDEWCPAHIITCRTHTLLLLVGSQY